MLRDTQLRVLALLAAMLCATAGRAAERAPDVMQGDGRVSAFYAWDAAIPAPGQLLRQEKLEPTLGLAKAGAQYRILYSSTDGIDGKSPVIVSGLLFLPPGEPPAGGWPLLALGTRDRRDGRYLRAVMGRLLAADRGISQCVAGARRCGGRDRLPGARYNGAASLHGRAAWRLWRARQRAVQKSFPALGKKTVLAGYSQGAGAVFGAAALQPGYAPEMDLRGIIATGTSYTTPETVVTMRKETASQASYTLIYPLYVALVMQQFDPALKESDMFSDKALPLFEATRHACLGQLVIDVLSSGLTRNESIKPGYAAALDKLVPLLDYPSLKLPKPVFMGIGELDADAPARLQLELAKKACAAGTTVEAHLYAGATHDAAVAFSLPAALRFADRVMAGEAITPVCTPEDE